MEKIKYFNKITVAIVTKDRPMYLKRQLAIFKDLGFNFQIIVMDGSEVDSLRFETKKLAESVNARYFHEISILLRYQLLTEMLSTEYVAYCADDDLIDPRYYERACDFLEVNSQYTVAAGRSMAFAYRKHVFLRLGGFTIPHLVNDYDIVLGDFVEKINKRDQAYIMGCPPTFYALRRVGVHKLFAENLAKITYLSGMERLESILNLTEGGITVIDYPMGFRDYSAASSSDPNRDHPIQYIGDEDIKILQNVIEARLKIKGEGDEFIKYAKKYAWPLPARKNTGRYIDNRNTWQFYFNEINNEFITRDILMRAIVRNNKEIISAFNS